MSNNEPPRTGRKAAFVSTARARAGDLIIGLLRQLRRISVLALLAQVAAAIFAWRQVTVGWEQARIYQQQLDSMNSSSTQADAMLEQYRKLAAAAQQRSDADQQRIAQIERSLSYYRDIATSAQNAALAASRSAKAAEENAQTSRQLLERTNNVDLEEYRARLVAKPVFVAAWDLRKGKNLTVMVTYTNVGKVQAREIYGIFNNKPLDVFPDPSRPPSELDLSHLSDETGDTSLQPGENGAIRQLLRFDDLERVVGAKVGGGKGVYVFGHLSYVDYWSGKRHFVRVCVGFVSHYDIKGENREMVFDGTTCPGLNDAD